jgi:hypothetical protein
VSGGASKAALAEVERLAREAAAGVRYARLVLLDDQRQEVYSLGDWPCRPGAKVVLKVRIPGPDDVTVGEA